MGKRTATGLTVTLLLLLGIAVFFYTSFKQVVISGNSMEPTFHDAQKVWTSKAYWLVGPIQKGDVVVIKTGTSVRDYIIKRVYGMPGDVIDWQNVPDDHALTSGEYRVPEEHVYVLGDNRDVSEDSRVFGPVPLDKIIGKIVSKG